MIDSLSLKEQFSYLGHSYRAMAKDLPTGIAKNANKSTCGSQSSNRLWVAKQRTIN